MWTSCRTNSSSSFVYGHWRFTHGPLTSAGFRTFCQRCRHCTSVLFTRNEAIFFQFLAPYYYTSCFSLSSSWGVHQCFWTVVGWRGSGELASRICRLSDSEFLLSERGESSGRSETLPNKVNALLFLCEVLVLAWGVLGVGLMGCMRHYHNNS